MRAAINLTHQLQTTLTNSRYHINANHTKQNIEQTKKTWYFSSTANKANIGQAFNAHNDTDLNSDLGLRA